MLSRLQFSAFLLFAAMALLATACGDDDNTSTAGPEEAEVSDQASGGAADTSVKPVIAVPEDDPPTELVIEDLVVGDGAEATVGDTLDMDYVGVSFSDGSEFDASWNRGETFSFQLGAGRVITGWDEGIEGMKAGGRRQLTIPPSMAYGERGQGPIGPNETLIFVVDLRSVN